MNLEEHLFYSDFIKADDLYISDGAFAIAKKYLNREALKITKNSLDIFEEMKNTVPFEKGKDFCVSQVGTICTLQPKNTICIPYNKTYGFDCKFIKMIYEQLPCWKFPATYVIENYNKEPILKFFIHDDFAACLMCMKIK